MWDRLPENQKAEYKRMILAEAALTELSAQKASEENKSPIPIISSKYQETLFVKIFGGTAEDIGNTSYDASIALTGTPYKFLVGIKTFGYGSSLQKIAQFKSKATNWASYTDQIKKNAAGLKTKDEINTINLPLYTELAIKISKLRNDRIKSSVANLRGFIVEDTDQIESVYHTLMPSSTDGQPMIYVGETSYDEIEIEKIKVIGCTSIKKPENFDFTDGTHTYHYTVADSQLLMNFNNKDIVVEQWNVKYAEDAYKILSNIADKIYGIQPQDGLEKNINQQESSLSLSVPETITESYSWMITNKDGEVERYSGFNSFYGTGSKLGYEKTIERVKKIPLLFKDSSTQKDLAIISDKLVSYYGTKPKTSNSRLEQEKARQSIIDFTNSMHDINLTNYVTKVLYRPVDEIYIPIPDSHNFHIHHPKFFVQKGIEFEHDGKTLKGEKEQMQFNLIFEPSGDSLECYITQDNGKAIQSWQKQSNLGKWILREIFQLSPYEPLTADRLNDININAIRLYKVKDSSDIHLKFIWIDKDSIPEDAIGWIQKNK